MKLGRMGPVGRERPVLIDGERILDLSGVIDDIGPHTLSNIGLERLRALDLGSLPTRPAARFGPCVGNVGKVVCVGLNYVDHALETGFQPPVEPIVFMKATSSLSGPDDPIRPTRSATKVDYEVELGVVIGTRAFEIAEEDALSAVAGYCVFNDVSERAFQLERGGQWTKGKSLDTFGPCGPWLLTADEVDQPDRLELRLWVNGELRQSAPASDMIFSVKRLIAYLSGFMTLMPGDLIATGTPPGVAMGMAEPRYLKSGDVVELEISGLGRQRQIVQPLI